MDKKTLGIIVILLVVLVVVIAGIVLINKDNQERGGGPEETSLLMGENRVEGQLTAQTGTSEFTVYKYSLTLPTDWQGKYLIQEGKKQVEGVEINNSVSFVYIHPEFNYQIFSIIAYPLDEWQTVQAEPGYHGTEIFRKDKVVFVYTISLDNPYSGEEAEEYQKMAGEVNEIIKSLKIDEK